MYGILTFGKNIQKQSTYAWLDATDRAVSKTAFRTIFQGVSALKNHFEKMRKTH